MTHTISQIHFLKFHSWPYRWRLPSFTSFVFLSCSPNGESRLKSRRSKTPCAKFWLRRPVHPLVPQFNCGLPSSWRWTSKCPIQSKIMKKKMALRQLANAFAMALLLALCASLVYLTVHISSETFDDESRVKRSLLGDNEYMFKNSLHKVHWVKTATTTTASGPAKSSSSSTLLPNPSRFDRKSDLDYIFISVKTATKFHLERLQVIIDTWFNLAPDQVSK